MRPKSINKITEGAGTAAPWIAAPDREVDGPVPVVIFIEIVVLKVPTVLGANCKVVEQI